MLFSSLDVIQYQHFFKLLQLSVSIITTFYYFLQPEQPRNEEHSLSTTQEAASTSRSERDRQITITLVLVSSIFLILTLPQYIRLVAFHYLDIYQTPEMYAFFGFSYQLTRMMFVTNSAVNFYIYIMSAAKFRQDLKFLFQGLWEFICCRRH